MKYIFIDTNLFIDAITSKDGENILNSIFKQLNNNIQFVLPEVIKIEIITQYNDRKSYAVDSMKTNLETKKILSINEKLTDAGQKKKQIGEVEAEKIDNAIKSYREEMIKRTGEYYESISKKINKIFKHRNTKVITITDQILLSGIKRSVLKRAPYTRKNIYIKSDKNENTHTKDIDCIAFEALVSFCKMKNNERKKNILIMCVSDQDYFTPDGELHNDLIKDIEIKSKSYKDISEMFKKEFKIKVESRKLKKTKDFEGKTGSLVGSEGGLIEESKLII